MSSSKARRVQLTGVQLKQKFLTDYTLDGFINPDLDLSVTDSSTRSSFTLKVGSNWQFRLGRFNELDNIGYSLSNDGKVVIYKSKDLISELFYSGTMFRKYAFPETIFICRDELSWVLFNSEEIIEYVVSNIRVRILDTGRIKVDLMDQTTEKYKAVFTLEYRSENHKRSFVFGAHGGGVGHRLYKILRNNCNYNLLDVFNKSSM